MTLATRIIFRNPTDPEAVYALCDKLVNDSGVPSHAERSPGKIHNTIGQGNRAILEVDYALDEPLDDTPAYLAECAGYVEKYGPEEAADPDPMQRYCPPGPYYVKVDLDSAYGLRVPGIGGCTEFHAAIILDLMSAFPDGGVVWYNEYAGTWHEGTDGFERFLGNGDDAMAWFQNMVLPIIAAETHAAGGEIEVY